MARAGAGRWTFGILGFIATMTAILAVAASSRPGVFTRVTSPKTVGGERSADARIAQKASADALSTLRPTEMLQGCLECPVSSYVGTSHRFR